MEGLVNGGLHPPAWCVADTKDIPLAVDLDGTLIRTDMTWELLARLLRRNPLCVFAVLYWLVRGRPLLKQKLGERVKVNPATLPYHEKFLAWLRAEKLTGRKIILATASDIKMAQPVADHLGLFEEVLASDGHTNLRSENKLRALTAKFGPRGFDYAGNSSADFPVWRGSREAVVVNASRRVLREAANCTTLGPTFCEHYTTAEIARRFLGELLWRSGYLLAALAGLLLALAFPKFNLAGFAWVAPALLLFAARGQNGAEAARTGYVAGLVYWLISLSWLLQIPVTGFPILGWVALCAYLALFFAAWLWLTLGLLPARANSWGTRTLWALGGAAAWVALEFLRAKLFSGFPWSFLGASQYKLVPLLQIASVTGVWGVSFLVAWFSLALFSATRMILLQPAKRLLWQGEIALPLIVVLGCYLGGFLQLNHEPAAAGTCHVTVIQPSVPQTLIWSAGADAQRFDELLNRSQRALTPATDLLVWPESAVPALDSATYQGIVQFAQSNHVWILFNGDDVEFHPTATNYFNSALLMNPAGKCTQVYHKRKLVIFGEYVPLLRWLPFLQWFTPITGGWTAGDRPGQFDLSLRPPAASEEKIITIGNGSERARTDYRLSPLVCFEDTFVDAAREAASDDTDFLINLTNDGWFGDSSEQWQHLANAVFRAVENNRPLVRCTNNGITCWLDGHGRIRQVFRDAAGSEYGPGAATFEIPLPALSEPGGGTFYHRHGDWLGWSCAGVTLLLIYRRLRRSRAV